MKARCSVWVFRDGVTVAFYGPDERRMWSRVFRGRGAVERAIRDLASCRTLDRDDVRVFWREDVETSLPRSVRGGLK